MNWKLWLKHGFKFSRHVALRSQSDSINVTAGHLTYVSLLSLVPLLVVTFTVFSAFPVFDDLKNNIESALFANLLHTSGEQLKEYIDEFVGNASQMTAVGIAFLFFVAVALISAIDSALNNIWRDTSSRRWTVSFAIYWMILTL
ncbi:MAG: YihY family inner membrane protein, partial [Pseudomonadota bacterium]|nr:YihY family inner membrane protein [Pseudomonadota bacterium]